MPFDGLVGHERVELCHLGALGVGGSATDEDARDVGQTGLGAGDDLGFKGRSDPGVRLCNRHGVVLPVDGDGLGRAFIALGVDDGVAGRAVFGDADVVDTRSLAAHLIEEAFDHLGGLGNSFTGVGDAGLLDPLLQVLDVLVDVRVDVIEYLLDFRRCAVDLGGYSAAAVRSECRESVSRWSRLIGGLVALAAERQKNRSGEKTDFPGCRHSFPFTLQVKPGQDALAGAIDAGGFHACEQNRRIAETVSVKNPSAWKGVLTQQSA